VAKTGIKVAMVKATQGTDFTAHSWQTNSAGARAAGIVVIPYHFMIDADPGRQAQHFQQVAGLAQGMPYALDWEKPPGSSGEEAATAAQVEAVGNALHAVTGRNPLGYWGIPGSPVPGAPSALMQTWDRRVPRYREGAISDFSKMPAEYTTPFNPPGGAFLFWQYTGGGIVGGIGGAVDRSVAHFYSVDTLNAWCGCPA
jgi:lysozyme